MAFVTTFHHVCVLASLFMLPVSATWDDVATYIVHMDKAAMPAVFSGHRSWYSATLYSAAAAAGSAGKIPEVVYVYDTAMCGFAARLSPPQVAELKRSPGFVACYRDRVVVLDTTHTAQFLGLTKASGIWPAAYYGEDVIVGVVDTGITPESASFNDAGLGPVPARWKGMCEVGKAFPVASCNRKLIGARGFSKGLQAALQNTTLKMDSPRDTDGHGTHTAATAAGSPVSGASFFGYAPGTATGTAPRARVAAYKVAWNEGVYTTDILAAIDQAIADGVDVLSISLGLDGAALDQDPVAIGAFAAIRKGIFVAASSGNQGPYPGLLHNGAPWMLTVGASTVDRLYTGIITLGDGTSVTGRSIYPGTPPSLQNLPLNFLGSCDNTSLRTAPRRIIVVCNSKNSVAESIQQLQSSRILAGIVVADDPFEDLNERFPTPGAIVGVKEAEALLGYISRNRSPIANIKFRGTILGSMPAPKVAEYSSRGPSESSPHILKPDIVAPGSLILSSWAVNRSVGLVGPNPIFSDFNVLSGSSMACPHAAGVAALLKATHVDWSPAAIRSAMMTTANPMDNTCQPMKDIGMGNKPATPLAMGSGQIEPNKAMDPGLIYDAGPNEYMSLLCAMNFTAAQRRAIAGEAAIECGEASSDLNYPSFAVIVAEWEEGKVGRRFERTVTSAAAGKTKYRARVEGMEGFTVQVVPEEMAVERKGERRRFEMVVEGRMPGKEAVVHGALTWVEITGKRRVRSPIVVAPASLLDQ